MIDIENLLSWPLDKLYTARGFVCQCGEREVVWYQTNSLVDAMRKLSAVPIKRKDFRYHFYKVLLKAKGVQMRGMELYGAFLFQNLVATGQMGRDRRN